MNFNIALNTIIYIMVFLFPGVLFRRFYFSGKYGNQFNHGNLFERFLWTLFSSIICLLIFGLLFYVINTEFNFELLHNITFDSVCNVFTSLATNCFPSEFQDKEKISEFGIFLLIVYAFSGLWGWLCLKTVLVFNLDKFAGILKFNNDWIYLAEPNKVNGAQRKIGDVHKTSVDILTLQKDKEVLYTGLLNNFHFDKENKLENIVISNASKFIEIIKNEKNKAKIESLWDLITTNPEIFSLHKEYKDKIVFRKNIAGQFLVLPASSFANINLTYILYSNTLGKWRIYVLRTAFVLVAITFIALLLMLFVKIDSTYFNTFIKKFAFFISGTFVSFSTFGLVKEILLSNKSKWKIVGEYFLFTTFFALPMIWVFGVKWYWTGLIIFGYLALIGFLMPKLEKDKEKSNV